MRKPLFAAWLMMCLAAAGCASGGRAERAAETPRPAAQTGQPEAPAAAAPARPALEAPAIPGNQEGLAAATDPCAMQLGDIVESMQLYYLYNKHLPPKLEDLQQYAEKGTTLKFDCPVTHQHYVYVPTGLHGSGIHDDLIVYDQSAAHRGERWGIVMSPPAKNAPLLMYVIPVSDPLLKAYGGK